MSDPHQRSEGAVLHDRKLAAWEYAVGERPRRIEEGRRRPHRGMLPDVDFGRALPDPGYRPLLSRIADFLWGDLRRSPAQPDAEAELRAALTAVLGERLGRRMLAQVATIVTPDTILRWHWQLIARKWTYSTRRPGRPSVIPEIRRLVVRMATENPRWGYTRIQGALKNLNHRVARSTIATILKAQGIPPSGERPTSWQAFLRAHWGAVLAADFFTTEVWTVRGLVTYYTLFVIELHSRRVSIVGSTPDPDEAFVLQVVRQLTASGEGVLDGHRVLICDRDRKWSLAVRDLLERAGVRVIQTPFPCPELQCPCGALCSVRQRGVSGSVDSVG